MQRSEPNLRRGFNRLFVVLTFVWAVYCLFVYPIQRQHQADIVFRAELQNCYEHELGKGPEFRDCLAYAQLKSEADMWSLKAFYARESWFLALVVVAVPLLVYWICRGVVSAGVWVWHGFKANPAG